MEKYLKNLHTLTSFTTATDNSSICVHIIANPKAGFFKKKKKVKKEIIQLGNFINSISDKYKKRNIQTNSTHLTNSKGHALEIIKKLAAEIKDSKCNKHLIISAGGDGTSNEICTALVNIPDKILNKIYLIRFPFGTGNDNSDGETPEEIYSLLTGSLEPKKTGYLEITGNNLPSSYAFNIASIGIDAYIVNLTNFFKQFIPGDSYKFMVDLGVLFYDHKIKTKTMDFHIKTSNNNEKKISLEPLMFIMGLSGYRTYGSKKKILPNKENICIVKNMKLLRRISTKNLFYIGEHSNLQEVTMLKGNKVKIFYNGSMPLQIDGEVSWLHPENFPVQFTIKKDKINIITNKKT